MPGIDWAGFEAIAALRGERSRPRLAYLDGVVELMSPSNNHERIKTSLGHVVEAYCVETDVTITGYGSWLIKDETKKAGLEPDECYVFGPNPRTKSRPDLAIEVNWSRDGVDKLEIYRRLGVPEVWFWQHDEIMVFVLGHAGYTQQARSAAIPQFDFSLASRLVDVTPINDMVRQLRAALAR
jgi:Uma2 family endonuclease